MRCRYQACGIVPRYVSPRRMVAGQLSWRHRTFRGSRSDRLLAAPLVTFPDLPVVGILADLNAGLSGSRTAVVQAPPGAGKTTLVPLSLLASDWLTCRCVVLEPRRIAARAAASRMAELLGEPVGQTVGYTTGEGRKVSAATRIEVVTDGVLIRRLQSDPTAAGIGVVIVDEFHERSVEADLALAFAVEVQQTVRPDLRIVVMSATLEGDRVATLLDRPLRLQSTGRLFDIHTVHQSAVATAQIGAAVAAGVYQALHMGPGDVLAFLPGRREIEDARAALADADVTVMPLYGALPAARQQQVLRSDGTQRRVVLATDIAESSLTVPGVRIVVDGGWARRPAFDAATGMSRLKTVRISRASADQRRGRAGRQGRGLCLRLWPSHEALSDHSPPAIIEEDLAPLALQVAAWGTGVDELALLDRPPAPSWSAAQDLLTELEALDQGNLTEHGREMAALPVHPRLAHMVLRAPAGLGPLAAEVAALLGQRDVVIGGGADLERRVAALHGRDVGQLRRGVVTRVRKDAGRIIRAAGITGQAGLPREDDVGRLVALAYPDRIARARGPRGSFVMAGGRGARMNPSDALAGQEMVAVATLDRGQREATIHLAAALDIGTVRDLATTVDVVEWGRPSGGQQAPADVVAERRLQYGAVVVSAAPLADPPREQVVAALLDGVAEEELRPLPWTSTVHRLRHRLRHLHQARATDGWPPVDDQTLLAELEQWLAPFLTTARRRRDLDRVALADALLARVPYTLHPLLDRLAPTHLPIPTGRRARVDYSGEVPVLAVKLQEMFGSLDTPRVAGEPVLLHLLSPAGRPLQITADLAGFWAGSYEQVRREMRGRYPKHAWPQDPAAAVPTRHTNRRSGPD